MSISIDRKKGLAVTALVAAACIAMAWVEFRLQPGYAVKSLWKLTLFLILPALCAWLGRGIPLRPLFALKGRRILRPLLLGAGVYALIMTAYLLLRPFLDLSGIVPALESQAGVTARNFPLVALYISLINSLLEEFFFRGYAYLALKKLLPKRFAMLFSAGAFALYHMAMMPGWFSPPMLLAVLLGLLAAGLVFNRLDEPDGTVWTSWLIHMCANLAINTVGVILIYS